MDKKYVMVGVALVLLIIIPFVSAQDQQEIELLEGWNYMSTNILPENTSLEIIFSPIINDLVAVVGVIPGTQVGEQGNKTIYFNNTWYEQEFDYMQGYKVNVDKNTTLTINGTLSDGSEEFNLVSGWQMISYLENEPRPVEDVFKYILDELVAIKNQFGVYWPDQEINTLGNMAPGIGYEVFISEDVCFSYTKDCKIYTQEIQLLEGWNYISTYIIPTNNSIENVFSPILDQLIAITAPEDGAQAGENNTIIYFNNTWNAEEFNYMKGYKVKVSENTTLPVTGRMSDGSEEFNLKAGWQMISYLLDEPKPVEEIFSDLSGFIIIKDILHVYWPDQEINTIRNMIPGVGYEIKVENDVCFSYAETCEIEPVSPPSPPSPPGGGGGGGGGGPSAAGGGHFTTLSTNETPEINYSDDDQSIAEDSEEKGISRFTGAVVGFTRSSAGLDVLILLFIIVLTIIIILGSDLKHKLKKK